MQIYAQALDLYNYNTVLSFVCERYIDLLYHSYTNLIVKQFNFVLNDFGIVCINCQTVDFITEFISIINRTYIILYIYVPQCTVFQN